MNKQKLCALAIGTVLFASQVTRPSFAETDEHLAQGAAIHSNHNDNYDYDRRVEIRKANAQIHRLELQIEKIDTQVEDLENRIYELEQRRIQKQNMIDEIESFKDEELDQS